MVNVEIECATVYINVSGEMSYSCIMCGLRIRVLQDFLDHIQAHFSCVPFECYSCNECYAEFDDLIPHIQQEHQNKKSIELQQSVNGDDDDDDVKIIDVAVNPTEYLKNEELSELNTIDLETSETNVVLAGSTVTVDELNNDEIHMETIENPKIDYNHLYDDEFSDDANIIEDADANTSIEPEKATLDGNCTCEICMEIINNHKLKYGSNSDKDKRLKKKYKPVVKSPSKLKQNASQDTEVLLNATNEDTSDIIDFTVVKPKPKKIKKNPYLCDVCGNEFASGHRLREHYEVHHQTEKSFKCPICGKGFCNKRYINIHLRFHNNYRPYECPHCDRKFFVLSHLKNHMGQHAAVKPHSCPTCGKGFNSKRQMKQHVTIHTGDRPYRCNICGMSFRLSHVMIRHRKTHNKDSKIRVKLEDAEVE